MVSGTRTTWEEETNALLKQAKERLKLHQDEVVRWMGYVEALERVLEFNRQQRGIKAGGQTMYDPQKLMSQSIKECLIEIAAKNAGLLVVNDAVDIMVEAKIFSGREKARNSIYSNIGHYKKHFIRERPGIYRLKSVIKELPLLLS